MSRSAIATIDCNALQHNFHQVRRLAPHSRIISVIKANAYGHGAVKAAEAMQQSDQFGVACIEEALTLRHAGITQPIVLLEGVFEASELHEALRQNLILVIHQEDQIRWLEQTSLSRRIPVWIKLNTGMNRLGFPVDEARPVLKRLSRCDNVLKDIGWMTHLACADERQNEFTTRQTEMFFNALQGLPGERSLANSAAIMAWPQTHADWVRPGIMLYGISPFTESSGQEQGLQPVMTLTTKLITVHALKKGESVGYGATWQSPENMTLGVAAIGYGDGYPRHAPNETPVLVNGKPACIVGRVSMDMICIDLRGVPDAKPGDTVTLWGQGLPVERVAEKAQTIAYELLCGVTSRVHFRYV